MCENNNDRRTFLGWLSAAATAIIALRPGSAHAKKMALPLSTLKGLEVIGGSVTVKLKEQKVLFVRDTKESVRAFDPTCTHKKCKVKFKSLDSRFHCKCHKSAFDLDGNVLGGPAKEPLVRFRSKLDGDRVLIDIPEKKA